MTTHRDHTAPNIDIHVPLPAVCRRRSYHSIAGTNALGTVTAEEMEVSLDHTHMWSA